MPNEIDITGLDKAKLLQVLFNNSKQQGMGFLDTSGSKDMTLEEAQSEIDERGDKLFFDYLKGRVMKVNLSGNSLNVWGYDRDNGEGAALAAVNSIR
jgi:hypothetical protein